MTDEELRQAVRELTRDGKASCSDLLALAGKTTTPPRELGALCNDMKVRVSACQLGCFG